MSRRLERSPVLRISTTSRRSSHSSAHRSAPCIVGHGYPHPCLSGDVRGGAMIEFLATFVNRSSFNDRFY